MIVTTHKVEEKQPTAVEFIAEVSAVVATVTDFGL